MTKEEVVEELQYIHDSLVSCELSYEALEIAIKTLSADVRENVKGEWEMINPQLAKCSVCGGYESTNGKDKTMAGVIFKTQKKYCPHCGADMRGDKDDNK